MDRCLHGTSLGIDTTSGFATRKPAIKQEATARGSTFHHDVQVYHESELEHRVSIKIQGRTDVRELHSQYPVFVYIDDEGVIRKHVCDFYIVFDDGYRLAVPVKYSRKEQQMENLIKSVRKAGFTRLDKGGKLTVGAVDDMRLMTEIDATIDDFENAQAILHSREHFDASQCEELYKMVRKLPGRFRFGELLRHSSSRAKRRTAIWQLIDRGHLLTASKGRIDELAWLRFRS